jgi:Tetratricopeptide repeat
MQTVVRDNLSEQELNSHFDTVIELCGRLTLWAPFSSEAMRIRRYYSQIVGLLLQIKTRRTKPLALVLQGTGVHVRLENKCDDAIKLLSRAVEIWNEISSPDNPETINAMLNLALVYGDKGHVAGAIVMLEQVLQKAKLVLPEEDLLTISIISGLSRMYRRCNCVPEATELQE